MSKVSALRTSSLEELRKRLIELRREQLNVRIQQATGQHSNVAKFREIRRDIARVKTIMNEKQING